MQHLPSKPLNPLYLWDERHLVQPRRHHHPLREKLLHFPSFLITDDVPPLGIRLSFGRRGSEVHGKNGAVEIDVLT
jgi:hypothetical protein